MSRKRPADTELEPESATKSSKSADSAGVDKSEYQTVQFKQSRAEVRPAADGRMFADPPFSISAASFDISKGLKLSNKQVIKKGDLDMIYFRPFLTASLATSLYTWCLSELPWFLVQYKARGMDIKTPRYTVSDSQGLLCAFFWFINDNSQPGCRFTTTFGVDASYKGQTMAMYDRAPRRIPETLQSLLDAVSEATGTDFNFVLMNFYQDGTHSISYHSDDEKFLGLNPTIASLSLGGSRDFLMKHKDDAKRKEKFPLESGDMLVMQGTTQSKWLHSIPKRTSSVQPRVNITFRKAMNAAGTNNYYKYNVGDGGVYRMINGKMSQTA
ncbi:MAG: hypothetical protein FRX49_00849 [Trebouxia sp. A1-2]|nr:MAG: hypothetical protein FRX49_00849 [Trebouxia sp. A1-2]